MPWPIETPPAHSTGLESKTVSGGGDNFSLDFPFYRTGQRGDHRVEARIGGGEPQPQPLKPS